MWCINKTGLMWGLFKYVYGEKLYLALSGIMQLIPWWFKLGHNIWYYQKYNQAVVIVLCPENRIVCSPYLQQFRGLVCCHKDKVNTAVLVSAQLGGFFPFIFFCWLSFFFPLILFARSLWQCLKIVRWPWIMSVISSVFFVFHFSFYSPVILIFMSPLCQ